MRLRGYPAIALCGYSGVSGMLCVTVLGQKGGGGKTTLALHFAVEATYRGMTVAVIDHDPQGSAMTWSRRRGGPPVVTAAAGKPLANVVSELARDNDLVLIDTAPHTHAVTTEAARLADRIVIPCRPSILDLDAAAPTAAVVARLQKPAAVILNQCPPGRAIIQDAMAALTRHPVAVCPITVGSRAAFSYSLTDGRVAREYEPRGKAAKEISDVWTWIMEKVQ